MPSLRHHFARTAAIAAPIALAQLAQMAMALTDTVMLGGIGGRALAAGGLGANIFFTFLFILQGVLSGVSVLAARTRGAGKTEAVPLIYWSGMALAVGLTVPLFALMSAPGPLLLALGEPAELAADVSAYLHILRWGAPAGLAGVGMMRAFLPAVGLERVMLWVIPMGVAVNAGLNWVLIHGGFGLPAMGLRGSAAATSITLWLLTGAMLLVLHGRRDWRSLVTPIRVDRGTIRELLAIGLPVGATVIVEATLFLASGLLAGALGQVAVAAHMIGISVASTSFMVPLAIGQAANVRVAEAIGAGDPTGARRAGLCAIGLGAGFMLCAGGVILTMPRAIASLYLGDGTATGMATLALAASLLRIAAVFQVADGVQVVASGALRGLHDTRVPMVLAAFGYWGIGALAGAYLAFSRHLGAVGLWWGLCAGLATTAAALTWRFLLRSRQGQGRYP